MLRINVLAEWAKDEAKYPNTPATTTTPPPSKKRRPSISDQN